MRWKTAILLLNVMLFLTMAISAYAKTDFSEYVQAPYGTTWKMSWAGPWQGELIKDGKVARWTRTIVITNVGENPLKDAVLTIVPCVIGEDNTFETNIDYVRDNFYVTNNNGIELEQVHINRVWLGWLGTYADCYDDYDAYFLRLGTIQPGESHEHVLNVEVTSGHWFVFFTQVRVPQ